MNQTSNLFSAFDVAQGEDTFEYSNAYETESADEAATVYRNARLGYVQSRPRTLAGEAEEIGTGVYRDPRLGYVRSVPQATIARELDELEPEIIGVDTRTPISHTTRAPFRWICHLNLNFGPDPKRPGNDLVARGSGTLIGPRHVLTAGHNLFNDFPSIAPNLKRTVVSIKVTPGYNCAAKVAAPFGSARVKSWSLAAGWQMRMDPQFDYGLITLDRAIGNENQAALGNRPLGFWGSTSYGENTSLTPKAPGDLKGKGVRTSGYPGDKCCFKPFDPAIACSDGARAGAQFHSSGTVIQVEPRLIFYDLDTMSGQSGSPVWLHRNLIAIHTGPYWGVDKSLRGKVNRGILITDAVLQQVRFWIRTGLTQK